MLRFYKLLGMISILRFYKLSGIFPSQLEVLFTGQTYF